MSETLICNNVSLRQICGGLGMIIITRRTLFFRVITTIFLTFLLVTGMELFLSDATASQGEFKPQIAASNAVAKKRYAPEDFISSTTTTTTTLPKPKPKPKVQSGTKEQVVYGDDIWSKLAACESGDPTYNGPSGYDGAFQFSPGTWRSMNTGYEYAWQAPFDVQLDAAKRLIQRSGWGQFPACARKLGML